MSLSDNVPAIIVKIGGSTLGAHDTTLADIAELAASGHRVIIVHGGGPQITRWLAIHQVGSRFVDGLRVTDAEALDVVVSVLAGMVNKQLVAQLTGLGVRAFGLCGADGSLLAATKDREELGYVGTLSGVNISILDLLISAGMVPVIAPIAMQVSNREAQLLNVNADTVAGEVAATFSGSSLVFLTDVTGVLDGHGDVIPRLAVADSVRLRAAGVLKGGMLPKIDACLRAAGAGSKAIIVDGRQPNALMAAVGPEPTGTLVG